MLDPLTLLRTGVVTAGALALGGLTYTVASTPSRREEGHGFRGLERRRALERASPFASVEPLLRWVGARLTGLLGDGFYNRVDHWLEVSGDYLGLRPEEWVALVALSTVLGTLVGALLGTMGSLGSLLLLPGLLGGAALPVLALRAETSNRHQAIRRRLPYVLDLLHLAMNAGLDFPGALRQVVTRTPDRACPLMEELTHILQQLALGFTRRDALLRFARRVPIAAVTEFVNALLQAEERGTPLSEVMALQAEAGRQRRSVLAEEAAAKAGVALVAPLFLLFACIMILVAGPAILAMAQSD